MSFKEQIMSKEKYSSIFLKSNGGYCVYYPLNIFRNTRDQCQYVICQSRQSLSIGLQNPPVFQYSDFSSVTSVNLEKKSATFS